MAWTVAFGATLAVGACSYAADTLFGSSGIQGGGIDGGPNTAPATCSNGSKDPNESDVDCGGGGCAPCALGKRCSSPSHCVTLSCAGNDPAGATCQPPSYTDGVKNGSETDVDCGGAANAPKCAANQGCRAPDDCIDGVCKDSSCTSPGATDGVKNGDETDVDCGGSKAPKCPDGKGCTTGADCVSTACSPQVSLCAPVTAVDGIKNGDETDVDCGGPSAGVPRCFPGKSCAIASDCNSSVCTGTVCQPPTGTDGVKNGDESDVDCGGASTGAPRCGPGRVCKGLSDCTLGCGYEGRCVDSRSCTRHRGGDTCGPGETPEQGKNPQHESCCAQGPVGAANLDKYLYTAGRARAVIEQLDGDLQGWVTQHQPPGFDPAWTGYLPSNKFDAEQSLGPYGPADRRGCSFGDSGGTSARTYDTDSDILNGAGVADRAVEVPRALLDEKPLNCVTYYMAAALCAYDNRRVADAGVLNAAIAGSGGRPAPWGGAPAMTDSPASLTAGFYTSFQNAGVSGTFTYRMPVAATLENSRGVPAPGRMYNSRGEFGHYDLYAPYLHWVAPSYLLWTYSWEGHGRTAGPEPYGPEAYHAVGFRCVQ